jgi:hypothetical protein
MKRLFLQAVGEWVSSPQFEVACVNHFFMLLFAYSFITGARVSNTAHRLMVKHPKPSCSDLEWRWSLQTLA